jgi:uncharacterized membrane protein YqiK
MINAGRDFFRIESPISFQEYSRKAERAEQQAEIGARHKAKGRRNQYKTEAAAKAAIRAMKLPFEATTQRCTPLYF